MEKQLSFDFIKDELSKDNKEDSNIENNEENIVTFHISKNQQELPLNTLKNK